MFVALPLSLGLYDHAFIVVSKPSMGLSFASAAVVQLLIFYVEILVIGSVVQSAGLQCHQRLTRTVIPLAAALFWTASYASLWIYGSFLSFRALAALFSLDSQISLHISSADGRTLAGFVVGALIFGATLRRVLSRNIVLPARLVIRRGVLFAALCVGLGVVVNSTLARQRSFADVMRRAVSPEFFLVSDLYQYLQELAYKRSGSFPQLPSLADWGKADTAPLANRPDVYILVVEALRGDVLSPENDPQVVVPNLYAFARKSCSYSRAYAGSPDTGYALETIVSGAYPYHGPLRHTSEPWSPGSFPHLFDLLHQLGYRTGFFSSTNWRSTARLMQRPSLGVYYDPSRIGETLPEPSRRERLVPELALASMLGQRSSIEQFRGFDEKSTGRFLTWVGDAPDSTPNFGLLYFVSSHYPWVLAQDSQRLYPTKLRDFPVMFGASGTDFQQYEPALHYKNVLHQTDKLLGAVLKQLEVRRARRPSIIVLVGDHGEALGEHGQISHTTSLYEEQVRVTLLINDETFASGVTDSRPISQVDIAPTILEMIGAPHFPGHQGVSLAPTSRNAEGKARKLFLTLQGLNTMDGVVEWPLKATVNAPTGNVSLFNLEEDPAETRDLAVRSPNEAAKLLSNIQGFKDLQRAYYSIPLKERSGLAPAQFE